MRPLTEWITSGAKVLTADEINAMVMRRNQIRQEYYDYFNSRNLDVILSPAGPAPAQPVGTTKYWAYTSMWNLLDWPAAVLPTGLFVRAEDGEVFPEPRNEHEKHLYETCEWKIGVTNQKLILDSASVAEGSPIGLQVIAPRWQDERLMAALMKIDEVLPLD